MNVGAPEPIAVNTMRACESTGNSALSMRSPTTDRTSVDERSCAVRKCFSECPGRQRFTRLGKPPVTTNASKASIGDSPVSDAVSLGLSGRRSISRVGRPYRGRPYSVRASIMARSLPMTIKSTGELWSERSHAFWNAPSTSDAPASRYGISSMTRTVGCFTVRARNR